MLRSLYQPLSPSNSLPLRRLAQKLDRGRRFISPELNSQKGVKKWRNEAIDGNCVWSVYRGVKREWQGV